MISSDPINRPSLSEIITHPWLAGPMPSEEEIHLFEMEFNQKL